MRALTISAHGGFDQIEVRDDIPTPELRSPTDVRIRVRAAAINHLDVFVIGGLPGVAIQPPWILGTDATGVIEAVGGAVTSVKRGDRVVINPGVPCRECEYCKAGEHPLCVRFAVLGEHRPGTIAEYVVVPEENALSVPASIGDAE